MPHSFLISNAVYILPSNNYPTYEFSVDIKTHEGEYSTYM